MEPERFPFLALYIRMARLVAAVLAVLGTIQAFRLWELGFWSFLLTLVMAFVWAFLVLVGADVLACFVSIEQNTRKS